MCLNQVLEIRVFPHATEYPLSSVLSSAQGPLWPQGRSGVGRVLTARVVEEDLVIEAQAQLRHARQEDTHLDGAHNLAAQHVAVGTDLGGGEAGVRGGPRPPATPFSVPFSPSLGWVSLTCLCARATGANTGALP